MGAPYMPRTEQKNCRKQKVFNVLKEKRASVFYESYELLNVDLRIPSTVTGSRKTITQS